MDQLTDERAEQEMIGQLLIGSNDQAADAVARLDPEDIYSQMARFAFEAIGELVLADEEVETLAVQEAFGLEGWSRAIPLDWIRLDFTAPVSSLIPRLQQLAARRKMFITGRSLMQGSLDDREDSVGLAEQTVRALEAIPTSGEGDVLAALTDAEVFNRDLGESPWLIDGIMYPQDRLMVVAAEGAGKTVLARQVALCAQCGVHPFTRYPLSNGPVRVLSIDLENRPRAVTHNTELVMRALHEKFPNFVPQGRTIEQPDGMNLLSTLHRRRFDATMAHYQPQLVILGPLYKAFRAPDGKTDGESTADEVAKFLDRMSRKHGFAIWIEHHAPFGAGGKSRDLRPYGTSYWQRWPEYGKNFWRDPKEPHIIHVDKFRNDRSLVYWPKKLIIGVDGFPFTGDYENRTDLAVYGRPATPADRRA